MTGRITWWAVWQHAVIGGMLCLIVGAILGPLAARIALPVVVLGFAAREAITAADRHDTTISDGVQIVLRGEPGFSPWNLLLQSLAPAAGGAPVFIFAGRMFQ